MNRVARTIAVAATLGACGAPHAHRGVDAMPAPLTDIPVYELTRPDAGAPFSITRVQNRDPLSELGATKRVTLTSSDADARTLLLWLAQEAGVNLVVSPDVKARVSVSFTDVPAVDAMRAIVAEAKLSILGSGMQPPWPPVVFYQLPVNVNTASADVIAARFGVSQELAKWIVQSRPD